MVGQEFSRVIREDVRSVRITPDRLAGLPQDYVDAHPVEVDGLVIITTDYPDSSRSAPFAHDAEARRALMTAFLLAAGRTTSRRCAACWTCAPNRPSLLGYASWPDFDAEVKMIKSGAAIADFIERIAALADDAGTARLRRAARAGRARTTLAHRPRRQRVDVLRRTDPQGTLRRGRPAGSSLLRFRRGFAPACSTVTGRLFGVEYVAVPDAPRWHEDVAVHDVLMDGETTRPDLSRPAPARGKYKHAAQFDLVDRSRRPPTARGRACVQLPARADGARRRRHAVS